MQKQTNKEDRRVAYTKKILKESLLELLKEKPIANITPTELCRRADINRNTFYAHYRSPMELLESIEDELLAQFYVSLKRIDIHGDLTSPLTEICRTIYDNRELCAVLLSSNSNELYLKYVVDHVYEWIVPNWKSQFGNLPEESLEKIYEFLIAGNVQVIKLWVRSGMQETPEELAKFLEKFNRSAIAEFLTA